ncbi:cytochrome P450, partial [Basidiobolus meristosporus CBS 931.73]
MSSQSDEIPGPKPHILLGNVKDVIPDVIGNYRRLHDEYGPVMRLYLGGHDLVSICDPDVIKFITGEGDFTKEIYSVYEDLAILSGRGLVTTATKDPDWILAHKLLMPAFSARAMKAYHDTMGKCILDLLKIMESCQKDDEPIDMSRWMISLALESIGVIGFGYNFNLLDDKDSERHPFSVALNYVQSMIMKRTNSVTWTKWLQTTANVRFRRDLATLRDTVDDVLKQRRLNPPSEDARRDLLDFMLAAESKDGEKLDDNLIRDEIITFLSAGHNTTSSFLSWTFFELARNPDVEQKILQEIVNAGIKPGEIPSTEQVAKCKYIDMVIKESLRFHSPIPLVLKYCQHDCTIKTSEGKEYEIKRGQLTQVQISAVHKDPKLWKNPNVFDPERFSPEKEAERHPCAWIPFSDGPRACIGRQFSLQEGKLALIMLLCKFRFRLLDETKEIGYQIIVSLKPVDLIMKVLPAELPSPNAGSESSSHQDATKPPVKTEGNEVLEHAKFPLPPVTFLYGTQTGTSEEYARKLSGQAREFGFTDVTVAELDDWEVIKNGSVPVNKEQRSPSDEAG